MVGYAELAKGQGCDVILYPELIVTAYLPADQVIPLAEPIAGPSVAALGEAAKQLGIGIVFGFAERDEDRGVLYNSMVALDKRGEVVAVYHKMHLWAGEKTWAEPGECASAFEIDGVRYSGWICYDTRFPELARLGALAGADVALVPTAWLGPGEEWELALRARALDNGIFVAGADIISDDPQLRCRGLSMIVGPKGNVLARAEPGQEGIIVAQCTDRDLMAQRGRVPLLSDRRPDRYGPLVR
jgi:predicted amidohydrolase